MRRSLPYAALTLVLMLFVVALAGCSETSTTSATSDETTTVSIPPAPADVSGLGAWFSAAYPDASWLSHIQNIEYVPGEVPGSGGFANAVVITTDLDFQTDVAIAREIATALGEANLTWAQQYVLWFADGKNELAGNIVDMTP